MSEQNDIHIRGGETATVVDGVLTIFGGRGNRPPRKHKLDRPRPQLRCFFCRALGHRERDCLAVKAALDAARPKTEQEAAAAHRRHGYSDPPGPVVKKE